MGVQAQIRQTLPIVAVVSSYFIVPLTLFFQTHPVCSPTTSSRGGYQKRESTHERGSGVSKSPETSDGAEN